MRPVRRSCNAAACPEAPLTGGVSLWSMKRFLAAALFASWTDSFLKITSRYRTAHKPRRKR